MEGGDRGAVPSRPHRRRPESSVSDWSATLAGQVEYK
jgi:hypothetical protein